MKYKEVFVCVCVCVCVSTIRMMRFTFSLLLRPSSANLIYLQISPPLKNINHFYACKPKAKSVIWNVQKKKKLI